MTHRYMVQFALNFPQQGQIIDSAPVEMKEPIRDLNDLGKICKDVSNQLAQKWAQAFGVEQITMNIVVLSWSKFDDTKIITLN